MSIHWKKKEILVSFISILSVLAGDFQQACLVRCGWLVLRGTEITIYEAETSRSYIHTTYLHTYLSKGLVYVQHLSPVEVTPSY